MRMALISDIHANLEALDAVLEHIDNQNIEIIHCLGDVIGYGPDPTACIEIIADRCKLKLLGNHEYVALGLIDNEKMNPVAKTSAEWTQDQLSDRDISMIADYDMDNEIEGIHFVHASPFEPDKWHYLLNMGEAKHAFTFMDNPICFFGHTHLPMVFSEESDGTIRQRSGMNFKLSKDTKYLVNVGSVGQPRDDDSRAAYGIYDTSSCKVEFHRVEYDIKKAQNKMIKAKIPEMLIERLELGR